MLHARHLRLLILLALASTAPAQRPVAPDRPLVFEPTTTAGEFFARAGRNVSWRLAGARLAARVGTASVALTLDDARPDVALAALAPTGSVSHYYLDRDPSGWRSHVPHHTGLRAEEIRPGVDLVLHAAGGDLEFDLLLQPGARRDDLRFSVEGARSLRVTADGGVALGVSDGELRLQPPVVYQADYGTRVEIPCRYTVEGNRIGFVLGAHDPDLALTIDPVVTFATLLGGTSGETVGGVCVDRFGNMVVTGSTTSNDFPLRNPLPIGYQYNIAYVTKFDAAGGLLFSTYFGGSAPGNVIPVDVGTDPDGQIVVGGNTTNGSLPTTSGVVQPVMMGGGDWFFVDLLAQGTLAWCTYYGGLGVQGGMRALKVLDIQRGSVLAVGNDSIPYLSNAYSQQGGMAVVGIFAGNVLWASTATGFSGIPTAVDVTAQGHICITGTVNGTGLPTTASSFQPNHHPGTVEGFMFVFMGNANSLVYATYFGGTLGAAPQRIRATTGPGTVDCTIAGVTNSIDLPLMHPIQAQKGAGQDGFVARLVGLTQTLDYSTYLGGADPGETVTALGIDRTGHTVVGGNSSSIDLPFLHPMKLTTPASNRDVWLARLTPDGRQLTWCTAWGGGGNEQLASLAIGPSDEIAVAGTVIGANMPTTPNALPSQFTSQDAFLARIDPRTAPSYGAGTPGWWSFVPVLAAGGPDQIGTTVLFNVHDGRAQAPGILTLGVGRTAIPFVGGQILTLPLVTLPLVLGGSRASSSAERGGGYLHFGFPIPPTPSLRGLVTDWQAAFVDAAAVGGLSLTNGVEVTVR